MVRRCHVWLWAIGLFLTVPVLAGEWVFEKTGSRHEDFQSFRGSWDSLPEGFSVSSDGTSLLGATSSDFMGVLAGAARTGGCYAWLRTQTNYAIGCQPTTDKFTPGFFQLNISNAAARSVEAVMIEYAILCYNDAERSSVVRLEVSRNEQPFGEVVACRYQSPLAAVLPAAWEYIPRACRLCFRPAVSPGDVITVRWVCDDAGGTLTRDELGLDDVRVTLCPPRGTVMAIR